MKSLSVAVLVGAALVAFGASGLIGRAPRVIGTPAVKNSGVIGLEQPMLRSVGSGSCASAACHGGPAVESLAGNRNEFTWVGAATHWFAVDPHQKAYAALESPLAKEMMSRMQSRVPATDDVRCLACHTNPSLANTQASPREIAMRTDGVSCEACHGDAGKWLNAHTAWNAASRVAACEETGMAKLFDLGDRAMACAGCHVGAPADNARGIPVRDMNHDMIAAGHPRLNFDFADYQRRLTPHWYEHDRSPDFEVKAWLVGRAAHAEASSVLTKDRAARGDHKENPAPKPEFAEFACVSCHHKVGDGYRASSGKPAVPVVWPFLDSGPKPVEDLNAERVKFAAATGMECRATLDAFLKTVDVSSLDRDTAGAVYHALAARERARMNRENRTKFDPVFGRLAKSLEAPRGNIDFRITPDAIAGMKSLLKQ